VPDDIPAIDDQPLALRLTEDQKAAARRGVLWRYEHGRLDAEETRDVLCALGLISYADAGRNSRKAPRGPRNRAAS
jgi:hypothetical protein